MKPGHLEILRFCIVGTIGFGVDAGTTLALTQGLHLGALPARVMAFLVAATTTWLLHRRYTFRSDRGADSWLPFVALMAVGAGINLGAYQLWLQWVGSSGLHIFQGVAIGSLTAMAFNFAVSKHLVFRTAA